MSERLGLWLAYWALRFTGNRELANISQVVPLIRSRRLALAKEPLTDYPTSTLLCGTEWWLWSICVVGAAHPANTGSSAADSKIPLNIRATPPFNPGATIADFYNRETGYREERDSDSISPLEEHRMTCRQPHRLDAG
jgi:hypothetical protein